MLLLPVNSKLVIPKEKPKKSDREIGAGTADVVRF